MLPGYDIGGDWFDYAENPDCAWIGIVDTQGKGPTAAGLGTVTLGAFRAARQRSTDPADAVATMHAVAFRGRARGRPRHRHARDLERAVVAPSAG